MPDETILVIDDDREILNIVSQILSMEGYKVHTANNGQDALKLLKQIPKPNLILLDLMMPVMSGEDFMDRLKTTDGLKDSPIVVFSAAKDQKCPDGAVRVLTKPVELDALLKVVSECASKAHV